MAHRKAHNNPRAVLTIEGECARPTAFSRHDLSEIHTYYQVPNLAKVDEKLSGTAVRLRKLIDIVGPDFHTKWLTVESEDGQFSACLPLDETMRTAVVVYEQGGKPIERDAGGPVRFIIPFGEDKCSSVKGATRMVISEQPGKDTRPSNKAEHDALHAK